MNLLGYRQAMQANVTMGSFNGLLSLLPGPPTSYASKRNDGIFQRTSVLASGTTSLSTIHEPR
jgi:hypothetical protein